MSLNPSLPLSTTKNLFLSYIMSSFFLPSFLGLQKLLIRNIFFNKKLPTLFPIVFSAARNTKMCTFSFLIFYIFTHVEKYFYSFPRIKLSSAFPHLFYFLVYTLFLTVYFVVFLPIVIPISFTVSFRNDVFIISLSCVVAP